MPSLIQFYENIKSKFKRHQGKSLVCLGIGGYFLLKYLSYEIPEVMISRFLMLLKNNSIEEVVVQDKNLYFKGIGGNKWFFVNVAMLSKEMLFNLVLKKGNLKVTSKSDGGYEKQISLGILLLSGYVMWKLMKSLESNKDDKKGNTRPKIQQSQLKFADIYGHTQTKQDLTQIIDYFKNPTEFQSLGARLRRGVLLYGPSGTGKTMIAKALANEAGVKFIYKSAAQFVEMYVGVGPRRIRDLFDEAKLNAPCIVFIDEIDAIGARTVQTDSFGKNNEERNATVNQLLVEMDGFDENEQVVVIAATNREKFLDFALVRSGRFDLKIPVYLPSEEERTGILLLKLTRTKHNISQEQALEFGKNTEGLSGADIDAIVNEAIYLSKGLGEQEISFEHLQSGQRKISQGLIQVRNQL